ncbi:chitobiase/beta-hexosaminidase-like protein [Mariniflexile fucanivorans]|uniref:Chitobiase/beta-hexosaminidase-like protein n=1 Tax=Mariniflexile fucanivorans TaxID=264023 RepID=A0A4R1RMG1_9FLAO|nr:chitobiase/beta-hexosaminidase C-terminal domain-containing protein [Mariniflexile fucanivorans]TCL67458.1 chitobiase/beta-hexosaminidase-like protein [Mariniflexile fucanivorans]
MMKNILIVLVVLLITGNSFAKDIYVSPKGDDANSGTKNSPYLSFEKALQDVKKYAGNEAVTVWFSSGEYYLNKTIEIGSDYSGTEKYPVIFSALLGAKVIIKGSQRLEHLEWKAYRNGIYQAQVPEGLSFDQLFVNEERQIRARFPNYDYENPLRDGKGYHQVTGGTDKRYDTWFSFDPKTFSDKTWSNPKTGIVHGFQSHNWGNMQYKINSINKEAHKILLDEGGWQLQRTHGIGGEKSHASYYFIENIFEELDVAGEWFLNTETNTLYYYPMQGVTLSDVKIEVPVIKDMIQLKGTKEAPVKNIQFKGFHFTQTNYTFMEPYEPVARGDWAIHRGGTIFMEGTENLLIEDCNFEYVGGNGIFMSAYNRNNKVSSCRFVHTGESAVCFVGSPEAVRFYQTWDDQLLEGKSWNKMREQMDLEAGPKTPDYPKDCVVENSIMHDFGDVGKQVAGVYISMSHKITASHNTIYNCPRAGICINDGTWGGHLIEFNDIWETVRETGEHGPFNSWGRERQWKGGRGTDEHFIKELTRLDAIDNVVIRNNRIANYRKSISAGNWTIDLDDGSSYYEIYNNLNLGSTIKLRDGMGRKVYNNITVSAVPSGWHVWPEYSEDEIYKNIFVISGTLPGENKPTQNFIRGVGLSTDVKWSENYDNNTYWNVNYPDNFHMSPNQKMEAWKKEGYDLNSVSANPNFVDPIKGNYQVKENSPALKTGFKNFPMDQFGHQMTRILPFGGDFENEIIVTLKADNNGGKKAKVYFTTDGSEPTMNSAEYLEPFKINNSTVVKARTFNSDGIPVGFTAQVAFTKVEKVTHPSWLSTLLVGEYQGERIDQGKSTETRQALEKELHGALLINIADDPDLIDATGGYNFGCYIKTLDPKKGKMWLDAGLNKDWVIQKLNKHKILHIAHLQKFLKEYSGQTVTITAVRDYGSKVFEVRIP